MPDRTQTLSVEMPRELAERARAAKTGPEQRRAEGEILSAIGRALSQPENRGDEEGPRVPDDGEMCPHCHAMPGEVHTPGCLKNPKPVQAPAGEVGRTVAQVREWVKEREDHERRNVPPPEHSNTPASGMTIGALETLEALTAYLNGDDDA